MCRAQRWSASNTLLTDILEFLVLESAADLNLYLTDTPCRNTNCTHAAVNLEHRACVLRVSAPSMNAHFLHTASLRRGSLINPCGGSSRSKATGRARNDMTGAKGATLLASGSTAALKFDLEARCSVCCLPRTLPSYVADLYLTSKARASTLHLPHGSVELPIFMPVATQASLKGLTPEQLEQAGCRLCLNNT